MSTEAQQHGDPAGPRIGFIGCGPQAISHMRHIKENSLARISAVCDLAETRAAEAGQAHDAETYTDHQRLLARDDLDAVYISVPVFAHGAIEMDVIERGLPFLVEKPVARQMETALEVLAAVEQAGLITCVGYQLRYYGTTQFVKTWLQDRTIGMIDGRYWCGTGRMTDWRVTLAKGGGQLVEQATHTIDAMRYLGGEIDELHSYQSRRILRQNDTPDVYVTAIRFASGAVGSLSATWMQVDGDWSQANILNILYDGHRVQWKGRSASLHPDEDGAFPAEFPETPSIDEIFLQAVATGDDSAIITPYREGVRSLAVSLAANRSAREGRPVSPRALMSG